MTISAAVAAPAAAAVDPDKVTPGLLGFLVVLGLGLATWVLLRSMNRQLKKVDFDDGSSGDEEPPPGEQALTDGNTTPGVSSPDRT